MPAAWNCPNILFCVSCDWNRCDQSVFCSRKEACLLRWLKISFFNWGGLVSFMSHRMDKLCFLFCPSCLCGLRKVNAVFANFGSFSIFSFLILPLYLTTLISVLCRSLQCWHYDLDSSGPARVTSLLPVFTCRSSRLTRLSKFSSFSCCVAICSPAPVSW